MNHRAPWVFFLCLAGAPALAAKGFSPGASGIGNPYFPLAGNGGYDVASYLLEVRYDPATDELTGRATIAAIATQGLSRFNLDLDGLTVNAVVIDGTAATWVHDGGELEITPRRGLREGASFTTVVAYHGVPTVVDTPAGLMGFFHTDDGALVVGEPVVAAHWFPVNDHPRDAASYTLDITVPAGLDVVANGMLVHQKTAGGWTTWRWQAQKPMASYLVGWAAGHYAFTSYRRDGIRFLDAVDADLFAPPFLPISGDSLALSGEADLSYKRITRELGVAAGGGELSFYVHRDTEQDYDFFFVEARPVGTEEWTTLPDLDGHASPYVGACALFFEHPFTQNYLTIDFDTFECFPTGTTGEWWAATGASDGWEQWRIDLSRYAGQDVEISLAYASDSVVQLSGVAIDDIDVAGASTSFEGGDTGGWQVPGAPPEGTFNENDWFVGGIADLPPSSGQIIDEGLAVEPDLIAFLATVFGPYPFHDAGAIVHTVEDVHFALENQTRPTYNAQSLDFPGGNPSLLTHELAHQWCGDLVRLGGWNDIWLNEGFATYASWLWQANEFQFPVDFIFDFYYTTRSAAFWSLVIADPGLDSMFASPVYLRGAMTLHALRVTVGDETFFEILRRWAAHERVATTSGFIALAEQVSGQDLGALFDDWLYTGSQPPDPRPPAALAATIRAATLARAVLEEPTYKH